MRTLVHAATLAALAAAPIAICGPALAQLQLPGAAGPSSAVGTVSGAPGGSHGGPAAPSTAGVAVRAPGEASLAGRELRLNGARGAMTFEMRDKQLVLTAFNAPGEKISKRGDLCQVDVPGAPFTTRPLPRADGLRRYAVDVPGCAFTLEVLEGAAQVFVADASSSAALGGTCDFTASDCRAAVAGIWGPNAGALNAEVKNIERVRSDAEKHARANFRALLAAAGRDKQKVRLVAAEQAGFSSRRAERCEDYAGESVHGFCASRITEAWAVALRARLNPAAFEADEKAPVKKPAPRKPNPAPPANPQAGVAPAGAPGMQPPMQAQQFR